MKVYIHIGLHKTGTTYLQYNIFPTLSNFHYVQLPPWRLLTKENVSDEQLQQYKATILKDWDGQKKIIISNEFFSGAIEKFTKKELISILDNLKKIFPQAQIITVLRSPRGYFNSLYNFRVVSRGYCTQSISDYYAQNKKYFLEKFDYDFLLKAINERFSKASIVKYESIKDNNQYVTFICKALDISPFAVSNDIKENTSSKKGIQVKTHLIFNRILLSGMLQFFPQSKLKNYLKVKYFNFKKTKSAKRLLQRIEKSKLINIENKLSSEQEVELGHFIKKYDELHFS